MGRILGSSQETVSILRALCVAILGIVVTCLRSSYQAGFWLFSSSWPGTTVVDGKFAVCSCLREGWAGVEWFSDSMHSSVQLPAPRAHTEPASPRICFLPLALCHLIHHWGFPVCCLRAAWCVVGSGRTYEMAFFSWFPLFYKITPLQCTLHP